MHFELFNIWQEICHFYVVTFHLIMCRPVKQLWIDSLFLRFWDDRFNLELSLFYNKEVFGIGMLHIHPWKPYDIRCVTKHSQCTVCTKLKEGSSDPPPSTISSFPILLLHGVYNYICKRRFEKFETKIMKYIDNEVSITCFSIITFEFSITLRKINTNLGEKRNENNA